MEIPTLNAKLNVPPLRAKIINRKMLTDRISRGIEDGCRLTLVSAPAGCGKSTVVNQWTKSVDMQVAWVTLDDGDNDPVSFFQYLAASLQKMDSKIGSDIPSLFGGPVLPHARSLTAILVNDLLVFNETIVIVLDDYHVIRNSYIDGFLQCFLENLPGSVHLIIMTREDPQLQLSKFRVKNGITELRAGDLCFDSEEACRFFIDVMGISVKKRSVDLFMSRTEGWIAGLQLAALSARNYGSGSIDEFAREFSGSNRYIIDYLVEEVIENLDKSLMDFIYATALFERMDAGLCNFITQRENSAEIINELEYMNLFLIPLDNDRRWYRYHHLFADSIRARLSKEYKKERYMKAAKWHKEAGYLTEAFNYSIKASDTNGAAGLLEKLIPELFESARLSTFLTLTDLLPEEIYMTYHGITVSKAWALLITGNLKGVRQFTTQLGEDFAAKLNKVNRGLYLGLIANLINYEENPDTERLALEALSLIEDSDVTARIAVLNSLADAQKRNGKTEEAMESYRAALGAAKPLGFSFITLLTLYQYGMTLDALGRRTEAAELAESFLKDMYRVYEKPVPLMGILFALLAVTYYEENSLPKAYEYASRARKFLEDLSLNWIINSDITLMNISLAMGKVKEAENAIDSIIALSKQTNFKMFEYRNSAAKAELDIRTGKIDKALEWSQVWNLSPDDRPNATRELWYFTYVRILLAGKNYEEAGRLIDSLESSISEGGRRGRLVTLLILKSILFTLEDDEKRAFESLGRAVSLASAQNYARAFLDEGIFVYKMLIRLPCRETDFVKILLAQFANEIADGMNGWTGFIKFDQPMGKNKHGLIEALSDRELELLRLIASGMSNSEISKKLYISINTTQWHLTNIYGKLGVKSRTQALSKVQELGLM